MAPAKLRISYWYKADGDMVTAGEPVCELETDKASADIPAPTTGILRHLAKAGDTVSTSKPIMRIDPPSGEAP